MDLGVLQFLEPVIADVLEFYWALYDTLVSNSFLQQKRLRHSHENIRISSYTATAHKSVQNLWPSPNQIMSYEKKWPYSLLAQSAWHTYCITVQYWRSHMACFGDGESYANKTQRLVELRAGLWSIVDNMQGEDKFNNWHAYYSFHP
jgi:hypothetical protein